MTISITQDKNFTIVNVFGNTFYFSYQTLIAVEDKNSNLLITKNNWSNTTGKHLNLINPDKKLRIDYKDFKKLTDAIKKKDL